MKNALLLIIATFFLGFTQAQNTEYQEAMGKALSTLKTAESPTDLQNVANIFDRIAQVATSEWLPLYYVAYTNNNLAWMCLENGKYEAFEKHIAAAHKAIEQAKTLVPDQAEVYVLEAHTYQALIMRQPMENGPRYAPTSEALINKAQSIDPDNPRAYFLLGLQWLHMPDFLGGGREKALPQFEKAAKKFESYQIASDLHPNWGGEANDAILSKLGG